MSASLHYLREDAMGEFYENTVTQVYLWELRFQQIQSLVSRHTGEVVSGETFSEDKHSKVSKEKRAKS